ncbi:MAG: DinB family protein, partial [Candidatus Bipolaricaulota bacterium]
ITSQIRAALEMLKHTIECCPDSLWGKEPGGNAYWVIAYHTLFFAHLYLSPCEQEFVPFERAVAGREGFGRTDLGDWRELRPEDVYSREDVLAYWRHVDEGVASWVEGTPLDDPSGFHWLPFSRTEAHLYNLRHIQHHAGQLADRLRRAAGSATPWVPHGRT